MGRALKGLIMEGGAMRGMFTCGVIDVLMENGIDFDGAGGISAGATFARAFDNCVAFGANFPGSPTSEHQPNERVKIDALLTAAKVYRRAFEKCVLT